MTSFQEALASEEVLEAALLWFKAAWEEDDDLMDQAVKALLWSVPIYLQYRNQEA